MSSQGVSLDKELLPHKFNATNIPKFKATDNPYFHLRAFETIMNIKGIDKKVFSSLFPLSLEAVCQQWFFSLDKEKTSTWESIVNAFVDRYKCNIQVETDHRQLEMLRQKENEGFTSFFNKWRETSAKMIEVPTEKESVRMFIKNLQEKYSKHLKYQHNLNTFKAVYDIGIEIEDDLAKQKATNNSNHGGRKGKKNDNPSSSENAHSSNNVSTFDHNGVLAMDNQGSKRKPRREFTPIVMTYDAAFNRLYDRGLIKPIGPTEDPTPENRSSRWNPNSYCKYNRGNGHTTDECYRFQNLIQDLIEANKIPLPLNNEKIG